jgi:carbon storage regulator
MEIVILEYEHHFSLTIDSSLINVTAFMSSDSGVVSIGIEAPRTLAVNREEIYKLKKKNGQE